MKTYLAGTKLFTVDRHQDGWTDRHDKDNSCFSQFCEHTQQWTIIYVNKNSNIKHSHKQFLITLQQYETYRTAHSAIQNLEV